MMNTYPVVIHCSTCAERFNIRRPEGIVAFNWDDDTYHVCIDLHGRITPCGLYADSLDTRLGTYGVELSEIELCDARIGSRKACTTCFAGVW